MLLLLACTGALTDDSSPDLDDTGELQPFTLSWTSVDEGAEGADLVIADDGTLYATFVRGGHVWIRSSADRGQTWTDASYVNSQGNPSTYGVSHPEVDVDANRVLVSMASGHNQSLWVAPRDTLAFEHVTDINADDSWQFEAIFFQGRFAPDGDIVASFHAFPKGTWSEGWKGVAYQSKGFELQAISDPAAGLPCECCAHDLQFTSSGPLLAWRGNDDDIRDMTVATGEQLDQVVVAGDLHPEISYCPVQGPRVAEAPDGELWMVWADAMSAPYAPYLATSSDEGATWSPSEVILAELDDQMRPSPTVALDGRGRGLVTWSPEIGASGGAVLRNGAWEQLTLERDLVQVEAVGHGDFLGAIGVDGDGGVWLLRAD
jgi:hypothetical protein